MSLGFGDAAILGGTFVLALAVMNVVLQLVNKAVAARNGGRASGSPADACAGCRHVVVETSYTMKAVEKVQGEQLKVLGDIRDGVRDLNAALRPPGSRGAGSVL